MNKNTYIVTSVVTFSTALKKGARYGLSLFMLVIFAASAHAQYCVPSYIQPSCSGDFGIDVVDAFSMSNINVTGLGCPITTDNYSDFTGSGCVSVCTGTTYSVSCAPGYNYNGNDEYFAVYIDFNGNGSFEDPGEYFYLGRSISGSPVTGNITIPAGLSATTTRIRIVCQDINGTLPGPLDDCGNTFEQGEAIDYCFNINASPAISLPADTAFCAGDTLPLDPGGAGNGYFYQWQDESSNEIYDVVTGGPYSVTVYNFQNGCSSSASTNVTEFIPPVLNPGPPVNQCGGTVKIGANAPVHNDIYRWSTGAATDSIIASTSGNYIVVVTDSNGCSSSASVNIYIQPAPYVNLGNDTTQCGGTVTLDAGNPGDMYHWSDNENTRLITVSSTNDYHVTVTDPNSGCSATGAVIVTINPAPVVNLGGGITQCGGTVTLDAVNPGDTYRWSDGSTNQTLVVATSGAYSVMVTDPGNGCTGSGSTNVYIEPTPYVNLGNDTTQCGGTITLNAGNPGDLYLWSNNETTQIITVASSNSYNVTVTDPNSGCTAVSGLSAQINPVPVVNLGPDVTQCGGSVTLDAGNPGDSFNWSDGTSNETTVATTSGLYSVTVTNDFNCSTTDSINIYIQTVPTVYLGQDITQCGGSVTLDAGNPGYNYLWNTNATTQTIQVSISGAYSVTVTNPVNGCPAADTINVTIDTLPVVNLGPDTTQCGGSITLNAGNAGSAYLWSDNSTNQTLVVGSSGIYRVTVTNSNGCTATGSITVTIHPIPVVTLTLPANVCLTVPPFALTGGLPLGGTYYEADTAISIFAPYLQGIGAHEITYVYANIYGCTDSDSASIFVRPQPFISIVSPPYLCTTSAEINLNNYFTPPGGKYFGIGVSQNYFYPNLSRPGIDTVVDIFTDNFGCMDTAGYIIPVHAAVHVDLTSSIADFTICTSQSITFTATGAEFYQFFVNGVAQDTPSIDSTFTTTTLSNHSIVYVVGSNPCSTDTSEPIVIDVIVPPVVNAGNDTTINLGQTVELHGTATGDGNLTYLWTPGTGLNFINVPNPTYSGSDSITFWFKATDSYGCADSAQVSVYVFVPDNVLLPTVITPNGDGYNDVWKLNSKINLDGSHLVIFDRWGEIVFETENYVNNWGGTYKTLTGKLLPDDTYYYVLNVPAQDNHTYTGPINIISGKQ